MKIANETKVGALAAIAIVLLILGYNFMKGENILTSNYRYIAVYNQIDGLIESNPVLINGYKVGYVSDIELDVKNQELKITVKVSEEIKVPKNSKLKIINTDLIGSKGVELLMGNSTEMAKDGDELIGTKDEGMAQALSKVLTPLSEQADSVLQGLNTTINGGELQRVINELYYTLISVKETAGTLNKALEGKGGQISSVLNNLDKVTADLGETTPKIKTIVERVETTSEQLDEIELANTMNSLNEALASFNGAMDKLNNGDGSLSKLINEDDVYVKLKSALGQLDVLLKDIETYPRRYSGITERQRKKGDKRKKQEENQ